MNLLEAMNRYIEWQRSHGAKFETSADTLLLFAKRIDGEIDCDAVTRSQVLAFLAGNGPLTRYRENKYCALAGFYRYAISRGYASSSPLPNDEPKPPKSRPPYIYSRDELCRLFSAIETSNRTWSSWTARPCTRCFCFSTERPCGAAKPDRSPSMMSICQRPC